MDPVQFIAVDLLNRSQKSNHNHALSAKDEDAYYDQFGFSVFDRIAHSKREISRLKRKIKCILAALKLAKTMPIILSNKPKL